MSLHSDAVDYVLQILNVSLPFSSIVLLRAATVTVHQGLKVSCALRKKDLFLSCSRQAELPREKSLEQSGTPPPGPLAIYFRLGGSWPGGTVATDSSPRPWEPACGN